MVSDYYEPPPLSKVISLNRKNKNMVITTAIAMIALGIIGNWGKNSRELNETPSVANILFIVGVALLVISY